MSSANTLAPESVIFIHAAQNTEWILFLFESKSDSVPSTSSNPAPVSNRFSNIIIDAVWRIFALRQINNFLTLTLRVPLDFSRSDRWHSCQSDRQCQGRFHGWIRTNGSRHSDGKERRARWQQQKKHLHVLTPRVACDKGGPDGWKLLLKILPSF